MSVALAVAIVGAGSLMLRLLPLVGATLIPDRLSVHAARAAMAVLAAMTVRTVLRHRDDALPARWSPRRSLRRSRSASACGWRTGAGPCWSRRASGWRRTSCSRRPSPRSPEDTGMSALILPLHPAPGPAPDAVPVRLPGGRVVALRPLRRGERDPLLAVFDGMSSASRARRYLTGMVRLPSTMLEPLTDVDGHRHVAWLASVDGQPVGIARCVRDAAGVADVAVEVVDDHHGLGIGSALVDAVTTVAAARGVRRVRASLTPDNEPSRRLVTRIGVRLRVVDDLLEGEGRLRLLDPPRVDRRAVLALARRAEDQRGRHVLPCPVHRTSTTPQRPPRRLEAVTHLTKGTTMSTTQIDDPEVLTELRAKQQQVWSSGDYNRIAALTVAVNETLVRERRRSRPARTSSTSPPAPAMPPWPRPGRCPGDRDRLRARAARHRPAACRRGAAGRRLRRGARRAPALPRRQLRRRHLGDRRHVRRRPRPRGRGAGARGPARRPDRRGVLDPVGIRRRHPRDRRAGTCRRRPAPSPRSGGARRTSSPSSSATVSSGSAPRSTPSPRGSAAPRRSPTSS